MIHAMRKRSTQQKDVAICSPPKIEGSLSFLIKRL